MPWLYQQSAQHRCNRPELHGVHTGDLWQCEQCRTVYVVMFYDQHDGFYWRVADESDMRNKGITRFEGLSRNDN